MARYKIFGLALIAVLFAAVRSGAPAFAEETTPQALPVVEAAAAPGCEPALDLALTLSAQNGICPTAAQDSATPEFMAKPSGHRTCRCSCGYPCTTNADCGPGGVCAPGVTCC